MPDIFTEPGESISRLIFENCFDGILLATLDGAILAANPAACHILGQTQQEIVESGWYSPFKAANPHFDDLLEELRAAGRFRGEIQLLLPGGSPSPVEVSCATYGDGDGDGHEGVILILRDVGKRGQFGEEIPELNSGPADRITMKNTPAENAIQQLQGETSKSKQVAEPRPESYQESYRSVFESEPDPSLLLSQFRNEQEAERRRLITDIHDGPLQSMGVALLTVERVLRRSDQGERKLAKREMRNLRGILTEAVAQVRSVLSDLSEEVLVRYGLSLAVQSYAEKFVAVTGIKVEVLSSLTRRLPADMELLMYRLAQEALSNVRKHSHAKNASVSIEETENRLLMKISDDGIGFNVAAALQAYGAGKKSGLRSMQQRIQAAGGDLEIGPEPGTGKGTALVFSYPL